MVTRVRRATAQRAPLTRARVLEAALALADRGGIESLSMRKLGHELGVEAMSLYNHVRNKDDVLDGLIDIVFGEIELPEDEQDWKDAMRRRAISARQALRRHTWAVGLMESRAGPGAANLGHHNAVLRTLGQAGFSIEAAAHAYSILDSYTYGFALTERSLPFGTPEEVAALGAAMLRDFPTGAYPHLAKFIAEHATKPGYSYGDEFEFGLDLILDGLERIREPAEARWP